MSGNDIDTPHAANPRLGECLWGQTARDRRNNRRFLLMLALWAVCFAGVDLVQEKTAVSGSMTWALAFLPALPAILALTAYVRFLLEADEMVRAVQLHGLALGFGAAVLVMIGVQWPTVTPRWADSDLILMVMMIGWALGSVWAMWRLR